MFHEVENHIIRSKMSNREMVKMSREDIINSMIDTVNNYNSELMRRGGLTDDQIGSSLISQRPGLEGMFGLIYDDLESKDVFK